MKEGEGRLVFFESDWRGLRLGRTRGRRLGVAWLSAARRGAGIEELNRVVNVIPTVSEPSVGRARPGPRGAHGWGEPGEGAVIVPAALEWPLPAGLPQGLPQGLPHCKTAGAIPRSPHSHSQSKTRGRTTHKGRHTAGIAGPETPFQAWLQTEAEPEPEPEAAAVASGGRGGPAAPTGCTSAGSGTSLLEVAPQLIFTMRKVCAHY